MSRLSKALETGRFATTAELNPPKGVDLEDTISRAEALRGLVDAVNLTDQAGANVSMSPLALAPRLLERGMEVVLQLTCRDRNRIALQGDLLGAHVLGVENVLCMTGDRAENGDHPEAKNVFDLGAIELLRVASTMAEGNDMAGNPLKGAPRLFLGAVVNPSAADPDAEVLRMEEKVKAGARFFQTQAVFDTEALERFMNMVRHLNVPVLAGVLVLKSGNMARNISARLPGVHVPETLVREMDDAEDRAEAGTRIAGRLLQEVKDITQGAHIMALGWERRVPQILEAAGLPLLESLPRA